MEIEKKYKKKIVKYFPIWLNSIKNNANSYRSNKKFVKSVLDKIKLKHKQGHQTNNKQGHQTNNLRLINLSSTLFNRSISNIKSK